MIEAFVRHGAAAWAPATQGTYRSALYRRADAFSPRGPRGVPFPGSPAPAPYTKVELAALRAMADGATSDWRRRSALVMLASGAGAGLHPGELVALVGSDVIRDARRVTVAVMGARPRLVPVVGRYSQDLAEAAEAAGEGALFRPGSASRRDKNFVNDFARKLRSDPADPRWSARRLRATFICGHLQAGTALDEVMSIAGVVEVESLARYMCHVAGASCSKAALRRTLDAQRLR
ncbi:MAG: hypothetical protein M0Z69_04130 [Actinomycetota bacterium]|nr:hypothetical protein [Actinomycetota bacterium]